MRIVGSIYRKKQTYTSSFSKSKSQTCGRAQQKTFCIYFFLAFCFHFYQKNDSMSRLFFFLYFPFAFLLPICDRVLSLEKEANIR
jgi:hypothetical protein